MVVLFELTDACNLGCKHCFNEEPKHGHMKPEIIRWHMGLVDEIRNNLTKENNLKGLKRPVHLSGGELSLNPHLEEIIDLFAKKNLRLCIDTNAVFAEQSGIKRSDLYLPPRELSNLFIERMKKIVDAGIGEKENIDAIKYDIRWGYKFVEAFVEDGFDPEFMRKYVNVHLAAVEFHDWLKKINAPLQDGTPIIEHVRIGIDKWHQKARKKSGYLRRSILSDTVWPSLSDRFPNTKIGKSQGEFPAYVGRAKNFTGFHKKKVLEWNRRYYEKNNLEVPGPYQVATLDELMQEMYDSNWTKMPRGRAKDDGLFDLRYLLGMCGCIGGVLNVIPDGSIHTCSYKITPPVWNKDGSSNPEFWKFKKIFDNGGPLAIARHAGMPEKQVYGIFMDKGPCGLCSAAMEYKKK